MEPSRSLAYKPAGMTRRARFSHNFPLCALDSPVDQLLAPYDFLRNIQNFYLCTPQVHSFGLLVTVVPKSP